MNFCWNVIKGEERKLPGSIGLGFIVIFYVGPIITGVVKVGIYGVSLQ